jgi:hypothetical protein
VVVNIDVGWPEVCKRRLQEMRVNRSFMVINEVENISLKGDILSLVDIKKFKCFGIFRLDDDDLISKNYTLNVAKATKSAFGSNAELDYIFIYSSAGYLYFPHIDRIGEVDCFDFPVAIGIGLIQRAQKPVRFLGSHNEIFNQSLVHSGIMPIDLGLIDRQWIYTRHKNSDSTTKETYNFLATNFGKKNCSEEIFKNFGVSESALRHVNSCIGKYAESDFYNVGGKKRLSKLWEIDDKLKKISNKDSDEYAELIKQRKILN